MELGALLQAEFRKTKIIAGFNDRGKHPARLTTCLEQAKSRNSHRNIFFLKTNCQMQRNEIGAALLSLQKPAYPADLPQKAYRYNWLP